MRNRGTEVKPAPPDAPEEVAVRGFALHTLSLRSIVAHDGDDLVVEESRFAAVAGALRTP